MPRGGSGTGHAALVVPVATTLRVRGSAGDAPSSDSGRLVRRSDDGIPTAAIVESPSRPVVRPADPRVAVGGRRDGSGVVRYPHSTDPGPGGWHGSLAREECVVPGQSTIVE